MIDHIKQVAVRIRDLREISGTSAETLATQLNIPLETYLGFESGNTDIPVSILFQIAHKFNVELTALLTGEEPHLHNYCLVRKGKGVKIERRAEYDYESLGFNFIHKKAEPFLVTVQPEAEDAPYAVNSHPGQEFDYVLKGAMKVIIDGHEMELQEGDSLFFDAHYNHGMKAANNEPAQFLAIVI